MLTVAEARFSPEKGCCALDFGERRYVISGCVWRTDERSSKFERNGGVWCGEFLVLFAGRRRKLCCILDG